MSRAGATAQRAARQPARPARVQRTTVRATCPECNGGVVHHIRPAGRPGMSYVDLHEVGCGCDHSTGLSYCNFGDGWLDAA